MADADIERIRRVLRYRRRVDLAELLKYSTSNIDESSTYGSLLFSSISYFEIYSPIAEYEQLKNLSEGDEKVILDAILEIYPLKAHSPEFRGAYFYVNRDVEQKCEFVPVKGLKELDFEYIKEQIEKSEEKIIQHDYEGAITNARTLVENCLSIYSRRK